MKVCVAGTGRVARALASVTSARGDEVVIWGADAATIQGWVASGLAARTTVFPQDEVPDADLLIIDGDLEFVGRTLRTYAKLLPAQALVIECGQPKNEALRTVTAAGTTHEVASITAVSDARWLVDVPEHLTELLRHTGVECLFVPARHQDLWRGATELAPALVAAALRETQTDLGTICPELDAEGSRLAAMTAGLPQAPEILADRQAAMAVLPRIISVLQDTMRWLEFQENERIESLLEPK